MDTTVSTKSEHNEDKRADANAYESEDGYARTIKYDYKHENEEVDTNAYAL